MATHPKWSFHNFGTSGNPSQVVIPDLSNLPEFMRQEKSLFYGCLFEMMSVAILAQVAEAGLSR
eukprot:5286596-Amphidinium_carterae.1